MATTAVLSTPSSVEDGTSDTGIMTSNTAGAESDNQHMSADDAASVLLSMGPILPANPEDTTCYWYALLSVIHLLCVVFFQLTHSMLHCSSVCLTICLSYFSIAAFRSAMWCF